MTTTIESQNDTLNETEELVLAAQDGDRFAFGELARRYEGMVFALGMRRLGNYAEAQELTQEVLVKAFEKLHQLKVAAAFGGWLRQITVRMAINRQVRRAPTVGTDPAVLEATCVETHTPLDTALSRERAQQVHSGLRKLGKLDRTTLEAFYMRGQSLAEMSESFAAPIGTIKRRLHVARKRLAVELDPCQTV